MSKPRAQRVRAGREAHRSRGKPGGLLRRTMPQLPDEENPRLVDPKPPRDVDELDVPEVDLKPTLPEAGLVLLLVDLVGDSAVETEPEGRFDVERGQSEDDERELQFQLPQERRRRHGSSGAAPGGRGTAWAGCAAAGCGRHSLLRAGIM